MAAESVYYNRGTHGPCSQAGLMNFVLMPFFPPAAKGELLNSRFRDFFF